MPRHSPLLAGILCVFLLAGLSATALAQQQGQYRSRVLLTPSGEIDKGAELSIEELEQQIGSIKAPYAKSSAGRHLARHYVEQKEYDKAIEFYRSALAAKGLSDVANREMLRELAQVYLLKEDYKGAARTLERALRIKLVPEVTDYLLLAQAHYRLGKYVAVVATLDGIEQKGLTLDRQQMRQALALYYAAGAYKQCEGLLHQLLQVEPNNPETWHQLVSVYLQQNKRRQALDQLALAREKSVPFSQQDILLLADLQAVNKNPYGAAQTLQDALARKQVKADGRHYRKLFEFWLQARENDKAQAALSRAARLTGDIELFLYLAQLQMEQRAWQTMYQTMLDACAKQLPDKYVGRANLLLGVSQLKLGDEVAARRSLINATLVGGVNAQAGQWLQFMNAQPATKGEVRRIVGICYGAQDKRAKVGAVPQVAADSEAGVVESDAAADIQTKTVPALRLFYLEQDMPLEELLGKLRNLAVAMNIALVKAGGSVDGPMQIISSSDPAAGGPAPPLQLAVPVRGSPSGRGRYKVRSTEPFKCAYLALEGEGQALLTAWLEFAAAVRDAGYEITGERRLVGSAGGSAKTELQLGIK